MDFKSRIKAVCIHLGLSVREFERECNLSRGNISNMSGAIGSDKLSKIIVRYPALNLYWLLTGEGEMLAEHDPGSGACPQGNELGEMIRLLREHIRLQNEQIALQNKQIALLSEALEALKNRDKVL